MAGGTGSRAKKNNNAVRKFSLPHMGNYASIIAEQLTRRLGWDIVLPPPNSNRSLEIGAAQMNELVCLPAKATLGNMIEACDQGVTDLLFWDSCGQCRLKAYWILQQRALNRMGYPVKVHPIRPNLCVPGDIRRIDPSVSWLKAWSALFGAVKAVARSEPEQPITGPRPQIGVIGEIYTVLDDAINHGLFGKLTKLGCFVHNSIPLSYFVFKPFYRRGWMKRKDMDNAVLQKAEHLAREAFPKEIGGHGNESIAHTIYYGLMGFDGVVHVAPFPCMPEFTVSSVVDEVARAYNISVIHFTFDVHTADAGLITRLEAFTDMLKRKRRS